MKLYRLSIVMNGPSEDTDGKFLAEIPALPGCRAWGDTAAGALENLQAVATAFIESYKERGDHLPPEVEKAAMDVGTGTLGEVLVAA